MDNNENAFSKSKPIKIYHDTNVDHRGSEPATFTQRSVAVLIDGVIMALVNSGLEMGLKVSKASLPHALEPAAIGGFVILQVFVGLLFMPYMLSLYGFTPGKKVMGIGVISSDSGDYLTLWRAFIREVPGKIVSSLILGFGYLMVLFRADRKALHDIMARSQVVRFK